MAVLFIVDLVLILLLPVPDKAYVFASFLLYNLLWIPVSIHCYVRAGETGMRKVMWGIAVYFFGILALIPFAVVIRSAMHKQRAAAST